MTTFPVGLVRWKVFSLTHGDGKWEGESEELKISTFSSGFGKVSHTSTGGEEVVVFEEGKVVTEGAIQSMPEGLL